MSKISNGNVRSKSEQFEIGNRKMSPCLNAKTKKKDNDKDKDKYKYKYKDKDKDI